MEFQSHFPIWNRLSTTEQNQILGALIHRAVTKGTVIHNNSMDCTGLLLVKSGQLRAYILSDEGREITIYRLFFAGAVTGALPAIAVHILLIPILVLALQRAGIGKE